MVSLDGLLRHEARKTVTRLTQLSVGVADLLIQDASRIRVHRNFTRLVRSATQRGP